MSLIIVIAVLLGFVFFFSSRRRHTMCLSDWSSDVCSSDLVKITYTREEVFWAHRGRPRTLIDLKTGVQQDGSITAVKARVAQDGGAYCSYGVVTILYSGALLGALYDIPNIQYDGYRVLTNKPACGAMRGHGTVNVRFAFESQLDELAGKIGMDPAEIRQRNLLQPPCI